MTLGTGQKRHLLKRYRGKNVWQNAFPAGVNVYIYSGMRHVKQKSAHVETVRQFINENVLKPVVSVLEDPSKSVKQFVYLLDKGTTVGNMVCGSLAKSMFTGHKRDKGIEPLPFAPAGRLLIPDEGLLPHPWEAVIANRDLTRASVYHLFYRGVMESYTPPPGKCVIIDGVPDHQLSKDEYDWERTDAFSRAFFVEMPNDPGRVEVAMSSREVLATPSYTAPVVQRGICPPHYTHNCAEDDLSAIAYLKHYSQQGAVIVIDGGDGDLIWTALLNCRDRIDPDTHKFINRVWVKLEGKAATREAFQKKLKLYSEYRKACDDAIAAGLPEPKRPKDLPKDFDPEDPIDGQDVYININALYKAIEHPSDDLSCAQYPQGMLVMLYILAGTDFFGEVSPDDPYKLFYGFGEKGWETCIFDTWCRYKDRFSHMMMMFFAQGTAFGQPDLLRDVHLNEADALTFLYQCYAAKYGESIRKETPDVQKITPSMLREHTSRRMLNVVRKTDETEDERDARVGRMRRGKNETEDEFEQRKANTQCKQGEDDASFAKRLKQAKKYRMPPDYILRRYIRLWLLNYKYWSLDYRINSHLVLDPLEKYKGLPYYGFIVDPNSPVPTEPGRRPKVILAPVVSPPKPVPEFYIRHRVTTFSALKHQQQNGGGGRASNVQAREYARQLEKEDAERHAAEVRQAEREERRKQRALKDARLSQGVALERNSSDQDVLRRALAGTSKEFAMPTPIKKAKQQQQQQKRQRQGEQATDEDGGSTVVTPGLPEVPTVEMTASSLPRVPTPAKKAKTAAAASGMPAIPSV